MTPQERAKREEAKIEEIREKQAARQKARLYLRGVRVYTHRHAHARSNKCLRRRLRNRSLASHHHRHQPGLIGDAE